MSKKQNRSYVAKILNLILIIILLVGVYVAYQFYKLNDFGEFVRSEEKRYISEFKRDKEVKYSDKASYKIKSEQYNDAMFFKTIKVEKNTPYKITCMVKTNEVEPEEKNAGSGAQISIESTQERSIAIQGTHDFQKIELIINSKDREEIKVGFRLGGYLGNCTGEAWFSDFTIEVGIQEKNNGWKFACFIFEQTDVNINGKQVKLQVTNSDQIDINSTIRRFKTACSELSDNKMIASCDTYRIEQPITSLSYSEEYGYYVAPEDIEELIKDKINKNDYDHIFAIVRLGDEKNQLIQVNDWIGLGYMDYYGIGFSNIRLPNETNSYIYKYNTRVNTFPEEVLLHEFLHSLERTAIEYGYEIPALHDYGKYGYINERLTGQKKWYTDYMNQNINTSSEKVGLPEQVYILKPAKSKDFEYSYKLDEFKEPENFIEEIREIFKNISRKIELLKG